jgi:subtilisin family serine protease
LAVAAIGSMLLAGVAAAPAAATPLPATVDSPTPTGAAAETHVVTLPTGDTVRLTSTPDGNRTFAVDQAPRPGGALVTFRGSDEGDSFYVVPSDAEPYLASGAVDPALFDVATLVREGRADGADTPVIVGFSGGTTPDLAGTTGALTLPSIDAVATRIEPDSAATFWDSIDVDGPAAARASRLSFQRGVAKVWLDRTVQVTLDRSVTQIGATAAHAAGLDGTGTTVAVLDTGYDPDHPDLAGQVAAAENFTPSPSVVDHHGHGTHVASTVAGTGAASGGQFRGVAPGASLLVGKVLDDNGFGDSSWIIAGMEWAAQQGADVISMSLNDQFPTDGTDPMSQAVDRISDETGVLVVASAGNRAALRTVYAPGAARAALTVGAVGRTDQLAGFSSRGPGLTHAEVKPEITAPGVGIAAARAAGTALGPVVDEHYVRSDGTSMATPHVAGAAAILAQAHPEWTGTELKAALTSTAVAGAGQWFEQGTGRVDVARAVDQGVYGPAPVSFGTFAFPQAGLPPVTRTLTFRNITAAPQQLSLALDVRGWNGQPAPAGAATLGVESVTVAAGGTATVPLTVDPAAGPTGVYGGYITATSADRVVQIRSAVSWRKQGQTVPVSIRVVDSRGRAPQFATVRAIKADGVDPNDPFVEPLAFLTAVNGVLRTDLASGTYHFHAILEENHLDRRRVTLLSEPEVTLPAGEVVLDARTALSLRPGLPGPADQVAAGFGITRGTATGSRPDELTAISAGDVEVYATPTAPVTTGFYSQYDQWTFQRPLVSITARGRTVYPAVDFVHTPPELVGRRSLRLAVAGDGADLAGKLALVRLPAPAGPEPVFEAHTLAREAAAEAAAAGAVAVLIYVDSPGALALSNLPADPLPMLGLSASDGERLRRLAGTRVTLTAALNPDRVYQLRYEHPDGLPAGYRQTADPRRLVRIEASYHSDVANLGYTEQWFGLSERHPSGFYFGRPFHAPATVTQFVGEPSADFFWRRQVLQATSPDEPATQLIQSSNRYLPGTPPQRESWFASPVRIGMPELPAGAPEREVCSGCREGDLLIPPQFEVDGSPQHLAFLSGAGTTAARMFRDGTQIPVDTAAGYPRFRLTPEPASYRLELETAQFGVPSLRTLATRTQTSWTFRSARPAPDALLPPQYACRISISAGPCEFEPLIYPRYDLGLDLLNRAPAGRTHTFEVSAGSHSATPDRAPVTGMRVSISVDGGDSWRSAITIPLGGGRFRVVVRHPSLPGTDGFVALRVEAWDKAGNRVVQTIERAYALRG